MTCIVLMQFSVISKKNHGQEQFALEGDNCQCCGLIEHVQDCTCCRREHVWGGHDLGPVETYNEDPQLNIGDTQVRVVHAKNRKDEENEAEGENMRATFIDSLV